VVDLAGVVRSAVEDSRPVIEAAGHRLTITLPPEPVWLDADPVRLAQVFANLLTNAAKYTDPQGRITLRATHAGTSLSLCVVDNGVGVAPEALERIFGMFAQVDAQHRRSEGGLGIGLALVRNLVQLHGGTVEVKSEGAGRGSEFTVRLPGA